MEKISKPCKTKKMKIPKMIALKQTISSSKYFIPPETGETPNVEIMSKLKNGEWILKGENFVPLKETILTKEDIKCEEDMQKIKQHSQLWFDLRNDGVGGLVQHLKKEIFKDNSHIKIVRASTLGCELGLYTPFLSKELGLNYSKMDEFKNTLLGKKSSLDSWGEINTKFGNNSEDKVTKAFLTQFNTSESTATVYETGTYILKDDDVSNIHVWCSPDGLFQIKPTNPDFPTLTGSWEAKSLTPFFPSKIGKLYDFNPYIKPAQKIKSIYIPQKIAEIYSTKSNYGFIGFHSLFKGTTFFLTKVSEYTDRFKKLMFLRLQWKYEYYKDYSENDKLEDNPFKEWEHDKEFVELLIKLSEEYLFKYELPHMEFAKDLNFEISKPFN